ncbi:MAG: FIST C-terminal domain-containing protein, partial [Gallionella sp.]|nr:FIST C-terminal domain-containing protein [Gallionella sp.]
MLLSIYRYTPAAGWDKALDSSLDSETTLLIAFGASDAGRLTSGISELGKSFPRSIRVGCSTAGEIYGRTLEDNSLVVAVMKFSHTNLRLATSELIAPDTSFQVGSYLASALHSLDLKGVFVLSDGLSVNGSELARGLSQNLPQGVVVTGGLAGDGVRFDKTWVLVGETPRSNHVVAVGLYGDHVGIGYGSGGGWDILGPERQVTHSKGNVLYSLDGQPALDLYKKYLGERATGLPATGLLFPLAIRNELEEDGQTVRTILSVNEDDKSITFAGDIAQGSFVSLMRANFERLIDGAAEAAGRVERGGYTDGPLLTVAISCVGRRLVLSQNTEDEIEAVLDVLPSGSNLIGYYSYGELSPLASGRCDLHNQTMTLTSFWERMDGDMNRLLARQLRKLGLDAQRPPDAAAWSKLLSVIDRTYHDTDQDRYTLERSLLISSEEMHILHQRQESSYETRLRMLFKAIQDMVWLKSPEGAYLACNPTCERFFGVKEAEIIGKTDYDLMDKERADIFRERNHIAIAMGSNCVNEELVTNASDGQRVVLEVVKTPMHDESGQLIGILGIARDVTERKKAEAEILATSAQLQATL